MSTGWWKYHDEIHYLPLQRGQANYYITPTFNAVSRNQSGYGRLQLGLEYINKVQSDEDMAILMESIMWRNEILNIPYAVQDKQGNVHFWEDEAHTIPSLDWRSDNVGKIPVNEAGDYVDINANTPEAKLVKGMKECFDKYIAGIEPEKNEKGFKDYSAYLDRCDLNWVQDDKNFAVLQKGLIDYYKSSGITDKLNRYYEGDEQPLRDDGSVWTTALSLSVNCTQKRLTVKFWEKPKTFMHYQWK